MLDYLPSQVLGERVLIRPYRPGDGAALFAAIDEDRPRLRRWLPWIDQHATPEDSEEAARSLHVKWQTREDLTVGVWERDGSRLLGGSGLHRGAWDMPSFEIGYWLRRSAEGQGLMTETVRLLCALAFGTLGASRVFVRCAIENTKSAAIPRRLGFRLEDTLRHDADAPEMLTFVLTSEDFAEWERG